MRYVHLRFVPQLTQPGVMGEPRCCATVRCSDARMAKSRCMGVVPRDKADADPVAMPVPSPAKARGMPPYPFTGRAGMGRWANKCAVARADGRAAATPGVGFVLGVARVVGTASPVAVAVAAAAAAARGASLFFRLSMRARRFSTQVIAATGLRASADVNGVVCQSAAKCARHSGHGNVTAYARNDSTNIAACSSVNASLACNALQRRTYQYGVAHSGMGG